MSCQNNFDNPKPGRPRETSLPYVAIDPHIESHPRTLALVDALADHCDTPETMLVMIPLRLFLHAGRSAIDGRLGRLSPRGLKRIIAPDIAIDAQTLFDAMTHCDTGFLVIDDEGVLWVHDWQDAGGRAATKRADWRQRKAAKAQSEARRQERYREKKRRQRARKADASQGVLSPGTGGGQAGDTLGTGGGQAKMSPQDKRELSRQNKDLEYSGGNPQEVSRILPVKGKHKDKSNNTTTSPTTADAPMSGSPVPMEPVLCGVDLDRCPDDQVLTLAQAEGCLVRAGLLAAGRGLGGWEGEKVRDAHEAGPIAAWMLREALGCAHKSTGHKLRYVGGTILKIIQSGRRAPQTAAPGSTHAVASKNRPETPQQAQERRIKAWRKALIGCGYSIDEQWLREQAEYEPDDDDIDLLRQCGGDWSRYHDTVRRNRDAGAAALARLGLACGVH